MKPLPSGSEEEVAGYLETEIGGRFEEGSRKVRRHRFVKGKKQIVGRPPRNGCVGRGRERERERERVFVLERVRKHFRNAYDALGLVVIEGEK